MRHRGCFSERLTGPNQGAQLSADPDADVFVIHGPDATALEAMLRSPQVVTRTPTSVVARVRAAPHATVGAVAASGCSVLWPVLFHGGEETLTVLAPTREHLDALVARLASHGLVNVSETVAAQPAQLHVNVPVADITTALTERQLIVLQTAIAQGYYESPRRTSTEALATAFGVTRSTLEEHLRKAERRILEGFADVLTAQPVIARAAARKPGRPAAKAQLAR